MKDVSATALDALGALIRDALSEDVSINFRIDPDHGFQFGVFVYGNWEIPTMPGGVMHTGPYVYVPRATLVGHADTMEGFDHKKADGKLISFLRTLQTDFAHWPESTDWTLESGPDEAPSSIDIVVPYTYRGATMDSWTSYGGQPGDPAEVETGTAWFIDDDGIRCEVNLTESERERVETWIYENPPEDDYGDDW